MTDRDLQQELDEARKMADLVNGAAPTDVPDYSQTWIGAELRVARLQAEVREQATQRRHDEHMARLDKLAYKPVRVSHREVITHRDRPNERPLGDS